MISVARFEIRGCYGIADLPATAAPAEAARWGERLAAGGACVVQLRMKGAEAGPMLAAAQALREALAGRAPLCVNDRLDVALAAGAELCHLGQEDLPLAAARAIAAGRCALGVSTHSLAQALAADAGGADYLGFGPVFATRSKANPDPVVGLDGLAEVTRRVRRPVVAIGGIRLEDAPRVAAAGAAAAAVIGAVLGAADPTAAVRTIGAAWAAR
jgi:thiamine-phosphate pyrophosphorylase